jgi:prepilin-type N-terminal cleavage/methylation domain-containing protein/prepilin-type processing-associated H-X9-DG protein
VNKSTKHRALSNDNCIAHGTAIHGFTLIELMVVIVILAVLIALGLGGVQRARRSAAELKSLAVLRSVAQANISYSADNNGQINTLKDTNDPLEGGAAGWVSNTFWGRLQPYLFQASTGSTQSQLQSLIRNQLLALFGCPDLTKMTGTPFEGSRIYGDLAGLQIPFAFNRNLYKWGQWIRQQRVDSLAMTAYLTYGFYVFDATDAQTYEPMAKVGQKVSNNIYYLPSQKAIMGFLDGHVENLAPPIAKEMIEIVPTTQ